MTFECFVLGKSSEIRILVSVLPIAAMLCPHRLGPDRMTADQIVSRYTDIIQEAIVELVQRPSLSTCCGGAISK
jgi:hypothetical protein